MSGFWIEDELETADTFEEMGEAVTYCPSEGAPVETVGVSSLNQNLSGGNNPASVGEMQLLRFKVGLPKYGDSIEFDSKIWRIIRIIRSDPNVVTVEIRTDARSVYR